MTPRPLFKNLIQIGLVVKDAEATASKYWRDFRMGPWTFYQLDPSNVDSMTIRGESVDHAMLTAHAELAGVDWELIQPLDDRSIYAEHLRGRGEGLHHVLLGVDDYLEARRRFLDTGHDEVISGVYCGAPYSYFDAQRSLACLIEIWSPQEQRGRPVPFKTLP